MRFVKMHGTGNDYVYVNLIPGFPDSEEATYDATGKLLTIDGRDVAKLSMAVSNRNFGIGSDGLIAIAPSEKADVRMIMYNADGSEGAMCGNGIRCVAKYAYDNRLYDTEKCGATLTVETASGLRELTLTIENGVCTYARVDMGQAILKPAEIPVDLSNFDEPDEAALADGAVAAEEAGVPEDTLIRRPLTVNGKTYAVTCVSVGNPHCVLFTEGIDGLDLEEIGPFFEKHIAFPEQINTEFVEVVNDHTVRMRVWERGSGETMSCGTGSCAVTVASVLNGYVKRGTEVEVQLRGGSLYDTFDENGEVWMRGPATLVYCGDFI